MARFWDRRADEHALFFIDNRLSYRHPDTEAFWAGGRADLDVLLGAVGAAIEPDDVVAEIGCGAGRLTRVVAERAAKVVAVDVSARMLDIAREHNPGLGNVTWLLGDGVSLAGVPTATADACISHVVFQHIPDPQVTLGYVREMGRVLRPGGWAAFQVSNDPSVHRARGTGPRAALSAALRRGPRGQRHPAWLGSAVCLDDLRQAARESGMEVERVAGEGTQLCFVLARRAGGDRKSVV